MTPNFKSALDAYASNKTGALNAHRAAAHITARFRAADDDHARMFRVPTPEHVARFGIVPAIERAGLTSPRDIREAVHAFLSGVHRRFHGSLARRTPQQGREHLAEAPPFLPLSDHYAGLHAALRLAFDADHPDNRGAHFDRWDYEEAIASATISELRTRADDAAREAKREARREAAITAPQPSAPATVTDEQRARYGATAKAKRADAAAAQLQAVDDALADLIDAEELIPGARISRADLADMVRATLPATLRRSIEPRRLMALILKAAESHGLAERVLSSTTDGKRTRARGFVYTPQPTTEQPEEATMNLTEHTESMHRAADAADRLTASLERLQLQQDRMLAGDRLGALQAQQEALSASPAPVTDLDAYRARRAA